MRNTTIRSTCSLDAETAEMLDGLARRWKVSPSEAVRRLIHTASEWDRPEGDALEALDALQRSLELTPRMAEAWARSVRRERGGMDSPASNHS
jgi:hypothetical protein